MQPVATQTSANEVASQPVRLPPARPRTRTPITPAVEPTLPPARPRTRVSPPPAVPTPCDDQPRLPPARKRTRLKVAQSDPPSLCPGDLLRRITSGELAAETLSDLELRALRRWCRERSRASSATVQRLVDRGHLKNARRERNSHLNRQEVLLDALFAASRKRWPISADMNADEAERRRRKRLLGPFEALPDAGKFGRSARAHEFFVAKENGGKRSITSFYWVDHARQRVLKSALTPFADLHDGQFMLARDPHRRGPAAVREALLAALAECSDDSVFMQFDVRDFYGSISHAWLERHLGIDPTIVQRQVHTGSMTIVPTGKGKIAVVPDCVQEASREGDRRGIPQGSVTSSLVAEQVMASVIRSVAVFAKLPLFIWSDNIGAVVPRGRAGEVGKLVRSAFAEHGAGPFTLHPVRENLVCSTFKFLGVWYRKTPAGPEALIPWQVLSAWEASIGDRLMHCWDEEVNQIERHVTLKLAHWRWCPAARETETRLRQLIQSRRLVRDERFNQSRQFRGTFRGIARKALHPPAQ
jgi:RNA-directed DNA polymerase